MSKILKKIRRKLITGQNIDGEPTNNKLYLKYAIGEIVLVVLGILIAIQINTWNELRKYKKSEKDMLTEIQGSLKESLIEIDRMIYHNNEILKSSEYVLNHLNSNLPYKDSLKYYIAPIIAWASPHFNYSAYETLKSRGLEIISNDVLKKDISVMYEKWLAFLVNDYDKYSWNYNSSVISPFFAKHFETSTSADLITATPNDYDALKKNSEFKNILKFSMLLKAMGNKEIKKTKVKLEALISSLDLEIEQVK